MRGWTQYPDIIYEDMHWINITYTVSQNTYRTAIFPFTPKSLKKLTINRTFVN